MENDLRERYLKAGVPEHAVDYYLSAVKEGKDVVSPEELTNFLMAEHEEDSAFGCC